MCCFCNWFDYGFFCRRLLSKRNLTLDEVLYESCVSLNHIEFLERFKNFVHIRLDDFIIYDETVRRIILNGERLDVVAVVRAVFVYVLVFATFSTIFGNSLCEVVESASVFFVSFRRLCLRFVKKHHSEVVADDARVEDLIESKFNGH